MFWPAGSIREYDDAPVVESTSLTSSPVERRKRNAAGSETRYEESRTHLHVIEVVAGSAKGGPVACCISRWDAARAKAHETTNVVIAVEHACRENHERRSSRRYGNCDGRALCSQIRVEDCR
jgi:hypothetical protein